MTPFEKFLESRGFHADACKATVDPDFFVLAETLYKALAKIGEQDNATLLTAYAKGHHARMILN